jgi:hypothetical protein
MTMAILSPEEVKNLKAVSVDTSQSLSLCKSGFRIMVLKNNFSHKKEDL